MKSLTAAQLKVLKRSHNNLRKLINDIEEMNDLYLSDIRELSQCFYDMGNEFVLDNSSYWSYKDPDDE
jgi:inactivated superfamily I helicase